MKNKSILPTSIILALFAIISFAEVSLFEEIKSTGRIYITNGTPGASIEMSVFNSNAMNPNVTAVTLKGSNSIGNLSMVATRTGGGSEQVSFLGGAAFNEFIHVQDAALFIANNSSRQLTLGHSAQSTIFGATTVSVPAGSSWGSGDIVWSGSIGGTVTNRGHFTSLGTITASNFVQSAGSGGFTGNGSGLTNINVATGTSGVLGPTSGGTGTNVAFTAGSVVFAGPSGFYNQNNSRFFWDNTNFRLGVSTNVPSVSLHINGPGRFEQPVTIAGNTSSIDSGTNAFFNVIVTGISGNIVGCYVTNVMADFPSTLTLAGSDLAFTVPSGIGTNSVVLIGRPSAEVTGWVTVGLMTNAGQAVIRGRNVTAGTIDQGNLPYRIQITTTPTINSQ